MTPARRPRVGTRRDGEVRRIRTDEVRYPTVDIPGAEQPSYDGRRLRPARDTGIAVDGRGARERRRARRNRGRNAFLVSVVVLVVATLGATWRYSSDIKAARASLSEQRSIERVSATDDGATVMKALRKQPEPTPIFATYGNIELRLPVPVEALTEVGFHQAAYSYALHLSTPLPDANMKQAKAEKTTHRDLATQQTGPDAILTGSVLRMWRSRPGDPDSAIDVGAAAGTDVLAPVTGTVVKIKSYKLYGRYADYEVHIVPEGVSGIDCVLIHVDDLSVKPGDRVVAGVTRIAAVRHLSDRIHHQLGDYTEGGGDHAHMQLNNSNDPDYKGLDGAVSVGGS